MGELDLPVPKEQPPRKLSGKGTVARKTKTLESGVNAPAEGITISGERTEGASKLALRLVHDAARISNSTGDRNGEEVCPI